MSSEFSDEPGHFPAATALFAFVSRCGGEEATPKVFVTKTVDKVGAVESSTEKIVVSQLERMKGGEPNTRAGGRPAQSIELLDRPEHGITVRDLWQTVFDRGNARVEASRCLDLLAHIDDGWVRRLRKTIERGRS